MRELDKAIKAYWYSRGFNKAPDTGGMYQMELDAFSEGYKAALEWALKSGYVDDYGDDIINSWDIEEELNATSEKRC